MTNARSSRLDPDSGSQQAPPTQPKSKASRKRKAPSFSSKRRGPETVDHRTAGSRGRRVELNNHNHGLFVVVNNRKFINSFSGNLSTQVTCISFE